MSRRWLKTNRVLRVELTSSVGTADTQSGKKASAESWRFDPIAALKEPARRRRNALATLTTRVNSSGIQPERRAALVAFARFLLKLAGCPAIWRNGPIDSAPVEPAAVGVLGRWRWPKWPPPSTTCKDTNRSPTKKQKSWRINGSFAAATIMSEWISQPADCWAKCQ